MSTHVLVSHAYIHTEDYNIPVEICGITVHPGDLIHADMHGFVIIPKEIAPRLYNACKGISDAELPVLNPCRDAIKRGVRPDMEELASWRKAMIAARTLVK
jgi:regulator of RNase E activity RraA